MNDERTPSSVVFPDPVPPETTMLAFARTQAPRNPIMASVRAPFATRSPGVNGLRANFRMVMIGPQSERGGMIALTRDPSESRAST
jgi:hypothetical protein